MLTVLEKLLIKWVLYVVSKHLCIGVIYFSICVVVNITFLKIRNL